MTNLAQFILNDTTLFKDKMEQRLITSYKEFERNFDKFQRLSRMKYVIRECVTFKCVTTKAKNLLYKKVMFVCANHIKTGCQSKFCFVAKEDYAILRQVKMIHNHPRLDINEANDDSRSHIVNSSELLGKVSDQNSQLRFALCGRSPSNLRFISAQDSENQSVHISTSTHPVFTFRAGVASLSPLLGNKLTTPTYQNSSSLAIKKSEYKKPFKSDNNADVPRTSILEWFPSCPTKIESSMQPDDGDKKEPFFSDQLFDAKSLAQKSRQYQGFKANNRKKSVSHPPAAKFKITATLPRVVNTKPLFDRRKSVGDFRVTNPCLTKQKTTPNETPFAVNDSQLFVTVLAWQIMTSYVEFERHFIEFQRQSQSKFIVNCSAKYECGYPEAETFVYRRVSFVCVNHRRTRCRARFNYVVDHDHVTFKSVKLIHNHDRLVVNEAILKKNADYDLKVDLTKQFDELFTKKCYGSYEEILQLMDTFCKATNSLFSPIKKLPWGRNRQSYGLEYSRMDFFCAHYGDLRLKPVKTLQQRTTRKIGCRARVAFQSAKGQIHITKRELGHNHLVNKYVCEAYHQCQQLKKDVQATVNEYLEVEENASDIHKVVNGTVAMPNLVPSASNLFSQVSHRNSRLGLISLISTQCHTDPSVSMSTSTRPGCSFQAPVTSLTSGVEKSTTLSYPVFKCDGGAEMPFVSGMKHLSSGSENLELSMQPNHFLNPEEPYAYEEIVDMNSLDHNSTTTTRCQRLTGDYGNKSFSTQPVVELNNFTTSPRIVHIKHFFNRRRNGSSQFTQNTTRISAMEMERTRLVTKDNTTITPILKLKESSVNVFLTTTKNPLLMIDEKKIANSNIKIPTKKEDQLKTSRKNN